MLKRGLASYQRLHPETRVVLANFAALQFIRTREHRIGKRHLGAQLLKFLRKHPKSGALVAQAEAANTEDALREQHVRMMLDFPTVGKFAQILNYKSMNAYLARAQNPGDAATDRELETETAPTPATGNVHRLVQTHPKEIELVRKLTPTLLYDLLRTITGLEQLVQAAPHGGTINTRQ